MPPTATVPVSVTEGRQRRMKLTAQDTSTPPKTIAFPASAKPTLQSSSPGTADAILDPTGTEVIIRGHIPGIANITAQGPSSDPYEIIFETTVSQAKIGSVGVTEGAEEDQGATS